MAPRKNTPAAKQRRAPKRSAAAEAEKQELAELRAAMAGKEDEEIADVGLVNLALDATKGSPRFGEFLEKQEERRRQFEFLQAFFQNPSVLELKDKPVPTSSPPEEIEQRIKEISYRIDFLEATVDVLKDELDLLNRALESKPGYRRRASKGGG